MLQGSHPTLTARMPPFPPGIPRFHIREPRTIHAERQKSQIELDREGVEGFAACEKQIANFTQTCMLHPVLVAPEISS